MIELVLLQSSVQMLFWRSPDTLTLIGLVYPELVEGKNLRVGVAIPNVPSPLRGEVRMRVIHYPLTLVLARKGARNYFLQLYHHLWVGLADILEGGFNEVFAVIAVSLD